MSCALPCHFPLCLIWACLFYCPSVLQPACFILFSLPVCSFRFACMCSLCVVWSVALFYTHSLSLCLCVSLSISLILPCSPSAFQENQVAREVDIDPRCHSRLIGQKGRSIRKIMDKFGVDVHFSSDKTSPIVTVSGPPENVEGCCEHLLLLVEEFVSELLWCASTCAFFKL